MSKMFGRPLAADHPCARALEELLLSGDPAAVALARNLMHDQRVSPERAAKFFDAAPLELSGQGLLDLWRDYFDRCVRGQRRPDYADVELNGDNFMTAKPDGSSDVHPDLELARVLDLTRLRRLYEWAAGVGGYSVFDNLRDDLFVDDNLLRWLDDHLDPHADGHRRRREEFVRQTLRAIADSQALRPFEPGWVTWWSHLEPHLSDGAKRWLEVLGLGGMEHPCWLIVLRYRVRDVSRLVRATVVDGGPYEFHFPSLEKQPGHPMDLDADQRLDELRDEYIHSQIRHPVEHWSLAGRWCERADSQPVDFERARRRHHERLQYRYGSHRVLEWMPSAF